MAKPKIDISEKVSEDVSEVILKPSNTEYNENQSKYVTNLRSSVFSNTIQSGTEKFKNDLDAVITYLYAAAEQTMFAIQIHLGEIKEQKEQDEFREFLTQFLRNEGFKVDAHTPTTLNVSWTLQNKEH